jgi:aspartyl protease family protein
MIHPTDGSAMRSFFVFAAMMLALAGTIAHMMDGKTSEKKAHSAQAQDKGAAVKLRPTLAVAATTGAAPATNGRRSVAIARDGRGHFQVGGRIDGRRVDFMVDTGASVIALTEAEARRLGIYPARNDFTAQVRTANGTVNAAPVMLSSVDIDGLVVRDVQALVVPGKALSENLLGLSYLTRLKRFEYAGGKLVLEN